MTPNALKSRPGDLKKSTPSSQGVPGRSQDVSGTPPARKVTENHVLFSSKLNFSVLKSVFLRAGTLPGMPKRRRREAKGAHSDAKRSRKPARGPQKIDSVLSGSARALPGRVGDPPRLEKSPKIMFFHQNLHFSALESGSFFTVALPPPFKNSR